MGKELEEPAAPVPRGGPGRGYPRMIDIARRAEVSLMTVSRALRSPDKVAQGTRDRIAAAIRELGYIPNSMAGSLASNRTGFIVVIVPNLSASIYADLYEGINDVCLERGFQILLGNNGYSLEREEALIETFLAYRPAGLILTGYTHAEGLRRLVLNADIPVVETFALTERPLRACVGYSNFEAMRALTRHVIARGRRHLALLGDRYAPNDRHTDRQAGFEAALAEEGIAPDAAAILDSDFGYRAAGETVIAHLAAHPETDAIICGGDPLAVGALLACQARGIAVPGRLAIAGFDDLELASVVAPGLTTVRVPRRAMGRRAAELLIDQTERRPLPETVVDMGFEIIDRGTT